jgi:hypothetical protein
MKKTLLAAALAAFASVPAGAATLYVGHGIPGTIFGDTSNKLPVDVCLVSDGTKSALFKEALNFGEFKEIEGLAAGRYDVEIQLFDNGSCAGTVAAAASIFLGIGENATAIAHLTEQATATVTKYVNDMRPLAWGQTRLYARHAAAVGNVDVYVKGPGRSVFIRDLENPDQEGADLRAGSTFVSISRSMGWWGSSARTNHGGSSLISGRFDLAAGTAYFAYAVGIPSADPKMSSFTVLIQDIAVK